MYVYLEDIYHEKSTINIQYFSGIHKCVKNDLSRGQNAQLEQRKKMTIFHTETFTTKESQRYACQLFKSS